MLLSSLTARRWWRAARHSLGPVSALLALLAGTVGAQPPSIRATASGTAQAARDAGASNGTAASTSRPVTAGGAKRSKAPARRTTARPASSTKLRYTTPFGLESLASDLRALLTAKVRSGQWGVMVVSLTRGDTLYQMNADEQMVPASTMKLFTTALAFDQFGPRHQFTTDVLYDGSLADGSISGNLYLRGGGDPTISNRFVKGGDSPIVQLARQVAASGIRRVRGDLIGDASAFEDKRVPDGWLARYLESSYAARVSALSMNENLASVVIAANTRGAAVVSLDPASTAVQLVNNVRVVAGSRGSKLSVRRLSDGRIEARGWIGSRRVPQTYLVVMDDPALFTTGALASALEAQGVTVEGSVRVARAPSSATRIASVSSPALVDVASVMNRESINHIAELMFRDVAHAASPDGMGSATQGNSLLQRFLASKAGVRMDAVFAADGSGLSTLDRVTSRSMVQLLSYSDRAPWRADFHSTLPVAGQSELLKHRMRYTPAQGNLHAKTGTTNDVIALGGFVTARNGEALAFSFLYNGRDRWNAREAIDLAGATLAGFTR